MSTMPNLVDKLNAVWFTFKGCYDPQDSLAKRLEDISDVMGIPSEGHVPEKVSRLIVKCYGDDDEASASHILRDAAAMVRCRDEAAAAPAAPSTPLPLEVSIMWLGRLNLLDLIMASRVSRSWREHAQNPVLWRHLKLVARQEPVTDAAGQEPTAGRVPNIDRCHKYVKFWKLGDEHVQRFVGFARGQMRTLTCSGLDRVTHNAFHGLERNPMLESVTVTFCPRVEAPLLRRLVRDHSMPSLRALRLFGCQLLPAQDSRYSSILLQPELERCLEARRHVAGLLEEFSSRPGAVLDLAICSSCTDASASAAVHQTERRSRAMWLARRSSFLSCTKCHIVECATASHVFSVTHAKSTYSYLDKDWPVDWNYSTSHGGCNTTRVCKRCEGGRRASLHERGGERLCGSCDERWRCDLCRASVCDGCMHPPDQALPELKACDSCGQAACRDCRREDGCTRCHRVMCGDCCTAQASCVACGKRLCPTCEEATEFSCSKCGGCGKSVCSDCDVYAAGQGRHDTPGCKCALTRTAAGWHSDELAGFLPNANAMCPGCAPCHPTRCAGCDAQICEACSERCKRCNGCDRTDKAYCADCSPPAADSHDDEDPLGRGPAFEPVRYEAARRLGLPAPLRCDFCAELNCPECQEHHPGLMMCLPGDTESRAMLTCDVCSRTSCAQCSQVVSCECCGGTVCREDAFDRVGSVCRDDSMCRPLDASRTNGCPICCDLAAGRGPELWDGLVEE